MTLNPTIQRSVRLAVFTFLLLPLCSLKAQTWTNFTGNLRWGTAVNWSPNTVPNAAGSVVNFQVDVPFNVNVALLAGGGGSQTPLLTRLKLGDTNGAQNLTLWREGTTTTSRLHFTNSVGNVVIEKIGDGNDAITIGQIRTYNNNLDILFGGGSGTLTFNNDIAEQAPFITRVNISGAGTLTLNAASTYTGGTVINQATVQIGHNNAFGTPAGLDAANLTIGNGGILRATGNRTPSANIGVLLKGGGNATFATVTNTQTLTISGPISSDGGNPSSFVAAGPGIISLLGANTFAGPTLVTGGTLSMIAANYTGGGELSLSDGTALSLDVSSNGKLDVSNATLGGSGDVTLNLNYGSAGGFNPSNPGLNVAGSFNPDAANIFINISGSNFVAGQFPLIDYAGSPLGSIANFSLTSLPPGIIATLVHNEDATSIDLNISLVVNGLTWFGSASDQWEIGGALNWNGGATNYNEYGVSPNINGDVVTFDDNLDGANLRTNINLTTTLQPTIVNVASEGFEYVFSGAGKLSGATILNKSGFQPVTILTANDHTGSNMLNQGWVRVGNNAALGNGTIVFAGGNLSSDGGTDRALSNPVRFAFTGFTQLGDPVNTGRLAFSGPLDFGNAARDFVLYNDVTFSGATTNGGLDQKQGPGAMRFQNVTGPMSAGQLQIEGGAVVIDGGTIDKTAGGIRVVCLEPGSTSFFSVTNGATVTMFATGGNLRIGSLASPTSDPSANNVVDIAGALIWATNNTGGTIQMGGSCTLAQLNLKPGGFLRPPSFLHEGNTTELNLEGGTLAPLRDTDTFLQGLTSANVRGGGAIIDTEGKTITIAQALLDGSGGGGLTKNGPGKLTLTGANTYTGTTIVNGGQLFVTPDHLGGGAFSANDGGALGVKLISAGTSLNASALTLGSSAGAAVEFDLSDFGNPTVPPLNVTTLITHGTVPVNIPIGTLSVGTFTLIDYTGTIGGSGFGAFTIGNLPQGVIATLVNNVGNSSVDLQITAIVPVLWEGGFNGDWDIGSTANWKVNSSPAAYQEFSIPGASVNFNDSATGTRNVIITTNVSPASVTVSNTSPAYSFSGPGKITGPASLTKQGSGNLTIATTNDYSGATTISAGKLVLSASEVIPHGAGKGNLTVNGTFDLAGFNETVNGLAGNGTIDASSGTSLLTFGTNNVSSTFSGSIANNGGTLGLQKIGTGTNVLSGNNSYSGGTTIAVGALHIGSNTALGTGPVTMFSGVTLSPDSTTPRTIGNSLLITANMTLGDSINNGLLSINGGADFTGAGRQIIIPSDTMVALGGALSNGRPTKRGPGTLVLTGTGLFNGGCEVHEGTMIFDGASITNSDSTRPDANQTVNPARLVLTNGAALILTGPTVNLRCGFTGGDANQINIFDISGSIRMPNTDALNGQFTVGRNSAQGFVNFYNGADVACAKLIGGPTAPAHSEVNFDGGILRATASVPDFISGLTLATIRNGGVTIDSSNFTVTVSQSLLTGGGNGGLTKIGAGTLLLTGANTYTGTTLVNDGTLGGTGTIAGPVTVASAATLSPGISGIGQLTINNSLTLSPGSITSIDLNKDTATNDVVSGLTSITYGGTLSLVNLGGALGAGDSFPIFNASSYNGSFAAISPSAPGDGLTWDTSQLDVNGTIGVASVPTGPQFNQPMLSGNTLSFSGSGGTPGGSYQVLTSTNVETPVVNWIVFTNSNFDGSGNFDFTDTVNPATPRRFYLLSTP